MAATPIGTNTWPIRIADGATDAAGSWAWYIKGDVGEVWDTGLIGAYDTGDDTSGATTFGQFKWTAVIRDVVIKTKANMDLLKRAFREWNDSDDDLYFSNKLGGVDEGFWAVADPWTTVTDKIRCKLLKIVWKTQMVDSRVCDVFIMRVTDV